MIIFILFLKTIIFSFSNHNEKSIYPNDQIQLNFYPLDKYKVDFRLVKPSIGDKSIQLCIPAAFTSKELRPEGLIYLNGVKKSEYSSRNGDGALFISLGKCQILSLAEGVGLTKNRKNNYFSLFQQFHLIKSSEAYQNPFKNKKLQMRVIAQLRSKIFIIESQNEIDSDKFINHLLDLGVTDALYLDMGSWSEGWYRDNKGTSIKIGLNRQNTSKQTNWLLFHN